MHQDEKLKNYQRFVKGCAEALVLSTPLMHVQECVRYLAALHPALRTAGGEATFFCPTCPVRVFMQS